MGGKKKIRVSASYSTRWGPSQEDVYALQRNTSSLGGAMATEQRRPRPLVGF